MPTKTAPTTVFGLKTCDTTRACLKALENADFVDVRETGVPDELLARAEATFGSDLLNTRSATWRGLDEATRASDRSQLLRDHPLLMKRPLIQRGDDLYLGWTKETRAALNGGAENN